MAKHEFTLHYFIPREWLSKPADLVRVTAYRIVNYGDFKPDKSNHLIDFPSEVRSVLVFGEIAYTAFDHEFDLAGPGQALSLKILPKERSKSGAWLMLFQPYMDEKNMNGVLDINLSSCVGIYLSIFGRSIAFEREFQIFVSSESANMHSAAIINPNALEQMNLSPDRFDLTKSVVKKISTLTEEDRSRFQLSLHWFERGIRQHGVDSLLSLWIAIEALAMKGTDIVELKRILKRIYTVEEVEDRFQIGRIFGIRSKIVHDGIIRNLKGGLLEFLEAMFVDVLLHLLDLEPQFYMKEYLDNTNQSIEDLTAI